MEENKECRQCANPNEKGLHTCVDRTELVESIKKIQQEIYEKKYYTPEIEEFHVGFEYEIFEDWDAHPEKEWYPQVYGENGRDIEMLDYVGGNDNLNKFRVKYLDRKDIESLGFIKEFENDIYHIRKGDVLYYLLNVYTDRNKYEIRCTNPSSMFGSFLGVIKNKSELKKVLKMIGI